MSDVTVVALGRVSQSLGGGLCTPGMELAVALPSAQGTVLPFPGGVWNTNTDHSCLCSGSLRVLAAGVKLALLLQEQQLWSLALWGVF